MASELAASTDQSSRVAIIMGSRSDWPTMQHAAEILDALDVGHKSLVVSAHRTPDRLYAFAKSATNEGFGVIIAGAGGAASSSLPTSRPALDVRGVFSPASSNFRSDVFSSERRRQAAIKSEFDSLKQRRTWKVIMRADMPPGSVPIKTKWVFKIKRNGKFRARLVACGYSQIPGVDFTEDYSPVIHDISPGF